MRKAYAGKGLIISILALLLFAELLAVSFPMESAAGRERTDDYHMVILGDSIFGQVRDDTSIPARLEGLLGIKVYNGALGGTCMGRLDENIGASQVSDALSMVGLSKAIVSGDFRLQEHLRVEESGTEYFAETIAGLKAIDFSQVELLLIGHCVNDYHAGESIAPATGDPLADELYDEHTFTGALRSAVQTLQEAYPELRIILVTPTYTWYTQPLLTCEEYLQNGNILEDYVKAQLTLAAELDVEIIDLYHDVYPHEKWEDWMLYSADGLHPNEAGRELLAEQIAGYLAEHPSGS